MTKEEKKEKIDQILSRCKSIKFEGSQKVWDNLLNKLVDVVGEPEATQLEPSNTRSKNHIHRINPNKGLGSDGFVMKESDSVKGDEQFKSHQAKKESQKKGK